MHSRPFPCVCFNFFFSSPNQIPYSSGSRSFCVWLWLYKNFTTPSLPWVALQQWVQGVTGLKTLCLIRHCCKHTSRCYLGCRSYFASVTPSFTPVIRHAWCCARWSELVFARELVRFWVSCCFQSVWIAPWCHSLVEVRTKDSRSGARASRVSVRSPRESGPIPDRLGYAAWTSVFGLRRGGFPVVKMIWKCRGDVMCSGGLDWATDGERKPWTWCAKRFKLEIPVITS